MFIARVVPANIESHLDAKIIFSIIDRQHLSSTTASIAPTPKTAIETLTSTGASAAKFLKKFDDASQVVWAEMVEDNKMLKAKLAKAEKHWEEKEYDCDRVKEKLRLKDGEMANGKGTAGLTAMNVALKARVAHLEKILTCYKCLLRITHEISRDVRNVKQENEVKGKGKDASDENGQGTKRKAEAMEDDDQ